MRKSVACHNWGDSRQEELALYYLLDSCRQILNLLKRELFIIRDTFDVNFSELLHLRTGTCRAEVAYVFVKASSQKQKYCKKWKSLTVLVQIQDGSQPRVVLRIDFLHCFHHFNSLKLEWTNNFLIYRARRIDRTKKFLSHLKTQLSGSNLSHLLWQVESSIRRCGSLMKKASTLSLPNVHLITFQKNGLGYGIV